MTEPIPQPQILAEGRFLTLQQRDGWEYASRHGARGVVAVVATTCDDRVILVEQHRTPVGGRVIELPAGLVGDEPGLADEAPRIAAERELLEETGYRSDRWSDRSIDVASSAGLTDETVRVFGAADAVRVGTGGGVGDERIEVHAVHLGELAEWLAARAARGIPADGRVWAIPLFISRLQPA